MKSRVFTEIKPYLIAFVSSAVPALVFTLLVRLCFMNEVFLRTLFTLLAWLGGAAALLSPLIIALVRFSRLLYAPAAPKAPNAAAEPASALNAPEPAPAPIAPEPAAAPDPKSPKPIAPDPKPTNPARPVISRRQVAAHFLTGYCFLLLGGGVLLASVFLLLPAVDLIPLFGVSAQDILSAVYAFLSSEPILYLELALILFAWAAFELLFLMALPALGHTLPQGAHIAVPVLAFFACTFFAFPYVTENVLLPLLSLVASWSIPFAAFLLFLAYAVCALLCFVLIDGSLRTSSAAQQQG